mmetsp:Transcript_29269/g.5285  ORF Transcript_29269/g.5285 Transcript_29269/m.5285 type:complete len:142 (+) Transcript_29269:29-454(+)
MRELKEIFDYFDKDKSGNIDAEELIYLLRCLGESPVDAEVEDMIAALDKDGSGTIEWAEFYEMMMERRGSRNVDDEIKEVFKLFDRDGTQAITKEGILHVMNTVFKENMSEEEANDMIRVAVGDRDWIDLDRFKEIMLNGL